MKFQIKVIYILLFFMIFTSCKVYRLNSNDNTWQPYRKGDVLVFENSNKKIDTITVSESYIYKGNKNVQPYNINNGRPEINSAIGLTNSRFINKNFYGSLNNSIKLFNVQNSQNGKFLVFTKYDYFDAIDFSLKMELMSKFHYVDKSFGDCYLIDKIDTYTYSESIYSSVLFSKRYGYLRFNFKDGSFVELKEFIRNGVNILPNSKNLDED